MSAELQTIMGWKSAYITLGVLLELAFRYPPFLIHPIRVMGYAIAGMERLLLKAHVSKAAKKVRGGIMAVVLVGGSYAFIYYIESVITGPLALFAFRVFFVISMVAGGCLFHECLKVVRLLRSGDADNARNQLSMLVTRDTKSMDDRTIVLTTIETLSENLNDGVIAPLFFLFIGGVPTAAAYKMASTLDSMVGYKNEKYEDFGWFSARLDDVLGYVPARITALLIIAASFILRLNVRESLACWKRDSNKTESPNSGNPESAMAGALGVQLGGMVTYFGTQYQKPYIGTGTKDADPVDVFRAVKLSYVTCLLFLITCAGAELIVRRLVN